MIKLRALDPSNWPKESSFAIRYQNRRAITKIKRPCHNIRETCNMMNGPLFGSKLRSLKSQLDQTIAKHKNIPVSYHMVDGVIDGLNHLAFPRVLVFWTIHHVVDVHSAIEDFRSKPFEEHGVPILTGEIDDQWLTWSLHIRSNVNGFRGFALILGGVRSDPQFVLGIRFWNRNNYPFKYDEPSLTEYWFNRKGCLGNPVRRVLSFIV